MLKDFDREPLGPEDWFNNWLGRLLIVLGICVAICWYLIEFREWSLGAGIACSIGTIAVAMLVLRFADSRERPPRKRIERVEPSTPSPRTTQASSDVAQRDRARAPETAVETEEAPLPSGAEETPKWALSDLPSPTAASPPDGVLPRRRRRLWRPLKKRGRVYHESSGHTLGDAAPIEKNSVLPGCFLVVSTFVVAMLDATSVNSPCMLPVIVFGILAGMTLLSRIGASNKRPFGPRRIEEEVAADSLREVIDEGDDPNDPLHADEAGGERRQ